MGLVAGEWTDYKWYVDSEIHVTRCDISSLIGNKNPKNVTYELDFSNSKHPITLKGWQIIAQGNALGNMAPTSQP